MASFSPLLRTTISRLLFFPQICHTLPHDATSRLLGLQSSWRKREPSHSGKSRELSPPSPPPSSPILRKRSRITGSPKAGPPAWAQAPAPLAFPRTLFSSCLLPTTVDFPPLQNYGSGDRNDPPGLAPPFIHCPTFFFFWFLLTTQLLGKCLHQLFSLPYLSFAQQPIPTWLPFRQLNLNGSCRLTSTLPAAKTAEHISVFTSFSLSEAFNPVG